MIAAIAKSFRNSSYSISFEDEDGLILDRGNYLVRINKVGDHDLDVWFEGPYGDTDVVLTSPTGLDIVMGELYDENYAQLGLSHMED